VPIDDAAIRRIVLAYPGIPDKLLRNLARAPLAVHARDYKPRTEDVHLTPELYETLKLLCRTGGTNRDLGEGLGVSLEAARDRVKRLLAYFDVPTRTALVAKCYRERIV